MARCIISENLINWSNVNVTKILFYKCYWLTCNDLKTMFYLFNIGSLFWCSCWQSQGNSGKMKKNSCTHLDYKTWHPNFIKLMGGGDTHMATLDDKAQVAILKSERYTDYFKCLVTKHSNNTHTHFTAVKMDNHTSFFPNSVVTQQ